MPTQMTDEEIRKKARERVQAKKGFFIHLTVYLAVNSFLWVIWLVTMGGSLAGSAGTHVWQTWPLFPTLGWGIGLVMHFFSVFAFQGNWEENEVEKEVARIKKSGGDS